MCWVYLFGFEFGSGWGRMRLRFFIVWKRLDRNSCVYLGDELLRGVVIVFWRGFILGEMVVIVWVTGVG